MNLFLIFYRDYEKNLNLKNQKGFWDKRTHSVQTKLGFQLFWVIFFFFFFAFYKLIKSSLGMLIGRREKMFPAKNANTQNIVF